MSENIRCSCEEAGKAIQGLGEQIKKFAKTRKCIDELCQKHTARQLAKMYLEMEDEKNSIAISADEYQRECEKLESELAVKEHLLEIKTGMTSKEDDLPFDPISAAEYLINLKYERETSPIERSLLGFDDTTICQKYKLNELEQIAEHLLIYCKHNKAAEI